MRHEFRKTWFLVMTVVATMIVCPSGFAAAQQGPEINAWIGDGPQHAYHGFVNEVLVYHVRVVNGGRDAPAIPDSPDFDWSLQGTSIQHSNMFGTMTTASANNSQPRR